MDWQAVKILGLHLLGFFYLELDKSEYFIVLILWILSTATDQLVSDDCDCNFSNSKSSEKKKLLGRTPLVLALLFAIFTCQDASRIKLHILGHASIGY